MGKKSRTRTRRQTDPIGRMQHNSRPDLLSSIGLWVWAVRSCMTIYVIWLTVLPPKWLTPAIYSLWRSPQLWVHRVIGRVLRAVGIDEPSQFLRVGAYYMLLWFVLPTIICFLFRRGKPADTGWRKPNRLLLRIVGSSFVVSIPFLLWMVRSPQFAPYYQSYIDAGPATVLTYYVIVLFCEHFLFEGVMLAAFRADGRWPEPPKLVQDASTGWRRIAQWFGVAQPTGSAKGLQKITRWLGIPDGCVGAILLSGILFGLVHWGKAGREFLLAFPGGVFLAALAYRCNSWHTPYLLHAGTVTTAAVIFLVTR